MDRITSISILLVIMVLALPFAAKALKHHQKPLKIGKVCILGIYLAANLYLTLFSRRPQDNRSAAWVPFWPYIDTLNGDKGLGIQIILNIPFMSLWDISCVSLSLTSRHGRSLLLAVCSRCLRKRHSWRLDWGLFEWDDMIDNTLGTVIGVACYWGMKKVIGKPLE